MIYQPRFWGCWLQQQPLEEIVYKRCIFVILFWVALGTIQPPGRAEQPSPDAALLKQLAEAHSALDKLHVTRFEPTNGAEWSLPVRIGVLRTKIGQLEKKLAAK